MMYYTYLLRCSDGTIYTGMTTDPERRLREHQRGGVKSARYTRVHGAVRMLAAFASASRSDACRLEAAVKSLTKAQKEALVSGDGLSILAERLDVSIYQAVPVPEQTGGR